MHAVAPVLEPYVNATHWRSGAPLPFGLMADVASWDAGFPYAVSFSHITFFVGWCAVITFWILSVMSIYCSSLSPGTRSFVFNGSFFVTFALAIPFSCYRWRLCQIHPSASLQLQRHNEHMKALYVLLYVDNASLEDGDRLLREIQDGMLKDVIQWKSELPSGDLRSLSILPPEMKLPDLCIHTTSSG